MTRLIQSYISRFPLSRKLLILCFAVVLVPFAVPAQQAAKKRPLTHSDYDSWRTLQLQQLTKDGAVLGYALNPQDADGEVVVRILASSIEWRHTRGHRQVSTTDVEPDGESQFTNETSDQRGPGGRGGRGGGGGGLSFTPDTRYAIFQIMPTMAENEAARKENRRSENMPRNAMGIMEVKTGKVERIERVRRFLVPDEGSYIAYLLEPKAEERPAQSGRGEAAGAAAPAAGRGGRQGGAGGAAARRPGGRTEYGTDLVLLNMADKTQRVIPNVLEFSFTSDAKNLFYTVSSRKPEENGVYRIAVGSADSPTPILTGRGRYTRLTWDEDETQMVFLSDRDDAAARQPKVKIYRSTMQNPAAVELVSTATPNFRSGFVISDRGGLSFSRDGSKLFFGISMPPESEDTEQEQEGSDASRAPAAPADEKVVADLWHWKDDFIQPMQRVRASQDRNRSYTTVYHIRDGRLTQLADESMNSVSTSPDGSWAFGSDDREYRIMVGYETGNYADRYLVNTINGSRKLLLSQHPGNISWSTGGKYGLFFDGKDWNSISIPDGKIINLTKDLGVNFWRETHDSPSTPGSYGSAGWTQDDQYVLLYDAYDIWQVAPDGSGAKNLTDGVGRKEKIEFRYVDIDREEREIDIKKPLLLRAVNEWTRDSGFYRDRFDGGAPQKLVMAAKNFGTPTKADDADVFMLTASTFNEFPDLLVCGPDFKNMRKVTNANPQRSELLWGTSELVRFNNTDGVPLSAILFKPENFDPKKKYPMLVYIYERLSNNVHNFVNPSPGTSINVAYYVSNGYLVLEPDIVYTIGYPGQSALKCVLPAIQAVVDKGFVDENAIGIQGHSWGGYQIAYMVTQTNRFRAAAPGALVANMTSAYSGIRWGTGLPRQFQYEHTQSRIGGNLWEETMKYIQNSPVFQADRVQTPILMLHNDNDDAVPWYQGIEYYLALRRLGKVVYMWNYNGEPHGLRKRVNQKDYTMRLQQFFDHYLKGAPMPVWMEKGIPYLDREKEKEQIKAAIGEKK